MRLSKYAKALAEDTPLHVRLTLLAISLVLSTAVIIGAVQYGFNTSAQLQREGERLQAELRLAERYLQDVVIAAQQKVAMLAATPPIQGLIRAERAGGIDPFDGSSEQLWKDRLAQIFEGFAEHDRDLLQVRYIQAANDGKELVRVDRRDGRVVRAPENRLQRKARQPYVAQTLSAKPGEVLLFDINLNRENGVIQVPHTPVLRVATPIYSENGAVYGLVILNFDCRSILSQIQSLFSRIDQFYLTSETGDYILHHDAAKTFAFDLGHDHRIQAERPETAALLSGAELKKSVRERGPNGEMIGELRKLNFDSQNPDRFLLAAAFSPADDILAASFASRTAIFAIVALLVALNAILASYLARFMVRPLKTLTEAANAMRNGAHVDELSLPVERGDEVGDLAKSFQGMAAALEQRQQELSRSNAELSRSNTELRDFAYIASHDLREPIRATASHASMLLDVYKEKLDQAVVDRLSRICTLCERMAHLTSTLLDYSRIDTPPEIEQIDTAALIDVIKEDLAELIEERNAEIVVTGALPHAAGNDAQLRIVFQNLIVNGLKYNDSDRPRIEIGGDALGTPEAPEGARFWVRDNGVGIDPEQQHQVFRIFKRLHRSDAFGEGTGVGLTFVKRVVEALGGEIGLDSALGVGTTFHFTNPGARAEPPLQEAA